MFSILKFTTSFVRVCEIDRKQQLAMTAQNQLWPVLLLKNQFWLVQLCFAVSVLKVLRPHFLKWNDMDKKSPLNFIVNLD